MGAGVIPSKFGAFVGRARELAELRHALDEASEGRGGMFLLSGEPGIGKTRLADELALQAKARGMEVLWGRCREGDGAPEYWPWIQIIRGFLGALDPEGCGLALESEVTSDVIAQVAQIVPELRSARSNSHPSRSAQPAYGDVPFRLFDAIANLLKIGARTRPMLVVLDDLHASDDASLRTLQFIARELKGEPILLVATHRDAEVECSRRLSKLIAEMSRDARPIPMRGLSASEVSQFLEVATRRVPAQDLVAVLRDATNGNPLFLDGVVRMLVAEDATESAGAASGGFKIPIGVREAIRQRLSGLSAEAKSFLTVAAAIGKEFDLDLCLYVAGASRSDALRRLDEALRAALVTACPQGQYRFAHALIRDALYAELDTDSQKEIHGKVATRLEEVYRDEIDAHSAELAHHCREAGEVDKAINYYLLASRMAYAVIAFPDAARHAETALLLTAPSDSESERRADILAWLVRIVFHVDRAKALKYCRSALALCESLGRVHQVADLDSWLGFMLSQGGDPHFDVTLAAHHLSRAESVLTDGPANVSQARLYNNVAVHAGLLLNIRKCEWAARRSLDVTACLEDKLQLANATEQLARSRCMGGKLHEGLSLYHRAIQVATSRSQPVGAAWGEALTLIELGDPRAARAILEREAKRQSAVGSPEFHSALVSLVDATYFSEGDLNELKRRLSPEDAALRFWVGGEWEAVGAICADAAEEWNRKGAASEALDFHLNAGVIHGICLADPIRGEAFLKYRLDNGDYGRLVLWEMRARPWLAHVYVSMGRLDDAAKQISICRQIMSEGEDWRGAAGYVAVAEGVVEAARGNFPAAIQLLRTGHAIQHSFHSLHESYSLQCWGRALAAAGEVVDAAEKFDAAIELHRTRGAGPRAIEWVANDRARALGNSANVVIPAPGSASFKRQGEYWSITYQGKTLGLKHSKGLAYIATLLTHPGERFHVKEMVAMVEGASSGNGANRDVRDSDLTVTNDLGGTSSAPDPRARADYRRRLNELESEIEEADRFNDIGRATRAREELDFIEAEFAGAIGIGGHARQTSTHAERARRMVGKAIHAALDKIRAGNPALGRHFGTSIRTGYFCSYQPEPDDRISWQL